MIDARTIELINAEIDGELDAGTRAELETALRTNPDARTLHEDLVRMAAALQGMSPVSIPAQLHEHLAAAIAPQPRASWPKRLLRWRRASAAGGGIRARTNLSSAGTYNSHTGNIERVASIPNNRSSLATSTSFHERGRAQMKTTKIIALGGSLAAAIAAVVYFGMDYRLPGMKSQERLPRRSAIARRRSTRRACSS